MMKKLAVILGLCLAASFLSVICPVYTKRAFHCDYTGSIKSWTEWPLGFKTEEVYRKSKLEEFMELKHPGELKHKWVSFQGTGYDIFGRPIVHGHGRPGPLLQVRPYLEKWCEVTSDQEKTRLYELLIHGDQKEIQKSVDGIWSRIEDKY